MEAILQARRKSVTVTVARPAKFCGISWEYWESALYQLRDQLGFLQMEHDLALIGLTVISTVSSSSAISRLISFSVRPG